jgi:hypothetical protein
MEGLDSGFLVSRNESPCGFDKPGLMQERAPRAVIDRFACFDGHSWTSQVSKAYSSSCFQPKLHAQLATSECPEYRSK